MSKFNDIKATQQALVAGILYPFVCITLAVIGAFLVSAPAMLFHWVTR